MPHVITGEIRKDVYTKEGQGNSGRWKMYAVDLSERMKIKPQGGGEMETVYTNYRAVFFANENMIQWYDEAFQKGKIVSVTSDTINLTSRDGNGTMYLTAEMVQPKLVFSQRGEGQQQQGQQRQQQNNQGWGQPQQPRKQQQQQQQPQNQQQFDDDIPF